MAADGEVAGLGFGQQVAGERVGILGGDTQAVATGPACFHARQPGQVRDVTWEFGADHPVGAHVPQFCGGAVGDDLAFVHEDDALGEVFCFLQVVGGEDDRAPLLGLVGHGVPETATCTGVHPCGRFVQDEDLRVAEDGQRETEALLLTAGAFAHAPGVDGLQVGLCDDLVEGQVLWEGRGDHLHGVFDRELVEQAAGLH